MQARRNLLNFSLGVDMNCRLDAPALKCATHCPEALASLLLHGVDCLGNHCLVMVVQPLQGAFGGGGWSIGNVPGVGGPPVSIVLLNDSKSGSLEFPLQQKFSLVHAPLSHHGSLRAADYREKLEVTD